MGLFSSSTKSESYGAPWAPMQGAFDILRPELMETIGTPFEFFPGQTYAGQTPSEAQAIEQMKAGAGAYGGMLGQYLDPATAAYQSALGAPESVMGMGLQDVYENPALNAAAEAIQSRVNRNLQENILPSLGISSMGAGGRESVAQGIAARGTQDVLAENLANMYGSAWQAGLGAETSRLGQALSAQQGAMGMAPGMIETALTGYTQPAAMLGQAGSLERAEEQRAIDEEMSRFQFGQMEPWQRIGMGYDLIMPAATAFGSTVSKGRETPSTLSSIGQLVGLGGAVAGTLGGMGLGGPGAMTFGQAVQPQNLYGGMIAPQLPGGGFLPPPNQYAATSMLPGNISSDQFNPWMWGR